MKNTPTMFDRDWDGNRSRVVDRPHPDCAWVFRGEGVPTRKIDGTSCMVRSGRLFKRRELKRGETAPAGFEGADVDAETGKTVGWMPVTDGPEDARHREALRPDLADGTYELVGPKVQGNPKGYSAHALVRHDSLGIDGPVPRDFAGLAAWLAGKDLEGLAFHHPDGRMAKIKLRDFGLKRQRTVADQGQGGA